MSLRPGLRSETHGDRLKARAAGAIMARVPWGRGGKSRLRGLLSGEQRLALQRAFLLDTLALLSSVEGLDPHVAYHPANRPGPLRALVGEGVVTLPQRGADLGRRLAGVAARLAGGYERVILVGTDSPTLPAEFLREAILALEVHDVCLGPALDGGYYLIGVRGRRDCLFESVDWGTSRVLGETMRNVEMAGMSCRLLPPWYDVDTPEDLSRLRRHLALMAADSESRPPEHSRMLLERFGALGLWRRDGDKTGTAGGARCG